jgi:DNA-directed RNA polymerase sigma subunit (sigma70/sigma32)
MEEYDELLKESRARAEEMAAFREEGLTLLEIGQRYGIPVERVRHIFARMYAAGQNAVSSEDQI